MRIALIVSPDNHHPNKSLSTRGRLEMAYFVVKAIQFLGQSWGYPHFANNVAILFSTAHHSDIEGMEMMAGCSNFGCHRLIQIDPRWAHGHGEPEKFDRLIQQINESGRENVAIFAYFSDSYLLPEFLNHWGINTNETEPKSHGWLALIDTDNKSVEFIPAAFADLESRRSSD